MWRSAQSTVVGISVLLQTALLRFIIEHSETCLPYTCFQSPAGPQVPALGDTIGNVADLGKGRTSVHVHSSGVRSLLTPSLSQA